MTSRAVSSESEESETEMDNHCFMEKVERKMRRGDYLLMLKDMVGPDTPRAWRDFKELIKSDFRVRIMVSEREKRTIFEDFIKALDQGIIAEDGQGESNDSTSPTLQPALRREIKEKLLLVKQKIDELMEMIRLE